MSIIGYFFPLDQPIALGVNAVILVALIAGLVDLYKVSRERLPRERSGLEDLKKQTRDLGTAEEIEEKVVGVPGDTIAGKRLRDLIQLWKQGDDIRPDLLSDLSTGELENDAAFARWASGATVLLGLGGTVWGLATSVAEVRTLLQVSASSSFEQAIANTWAVFSGLNVAFSTTLAGILSAVVLGALISILRRDQSRFLQDLERHTLVWLAPRFQTSVSQSMAQAAQNLRKIEQDLDGALRDVVDSIHTRGMALTSTIDKSFVDLTDEFRAKSGELLEKYETSWQAIYRMLGVPGEDTKRLTETLGDLQQGVEGIREAVNTAGDLIPELQEAFAREVDQQTTNLNEAMNSYTTRLMEGTERQEGILQEGVERVNAVLPQLEQRLAELLAHQVEAIERAVRDGTEVTRDTLQKALDDYLEQTHTATEESTTANSELSQRLEKLEGATRGLTEAGGQGREAIGEYRKATRELIESLKRFAEDVTRNGKPGATGAAGEGAANGPPGGAGLPEAGGVQRETSEPIKKPGLFRRWFQRGSP